MAQVDFQQLKQIEELDESWKFFMGQGFLRDALSRLVSDLEQNGIDYTVIGALALNLHGYTRATVDIDLLLTNYLGQLFFDANPLATTHDDLLLPFLVDWEASSSESQGHHQ